MRFISPGELRSWILYEDSDLLVVNKPGGVVCHPSKDGPWSSLVGACREMLGVDRLHMPSRLDRETSGVVVMAKNHVVGSRLQVMIEKRRVRKTYLAVLRGKLENAVTVDQPIGLSSTSEVVTRRCVRPDGQPALTEFVPLHQTDEYTIARVHPITGRAHQIRVHAEWLDHPIAGDKMYGVEDWVFLTFIREGWSERLGQTLPLPRHALHAAEIVFGDLRFRAPLTGDLRSFLERSFGSYALEEPAITAP